MQTVISYRKIGTEVDGQDAMLRVELAVHIAVIFALVKIRTVGLVNIAAGGDRVPELLQDELTADRVDALARRLLFDAREREEQRRYLAPLRDRLGGGGSAERAADAVVEMLGEGKR